MNTRHDEDYNFVFKIILLGDSNVGKTHLLSRYIKGQLPRSKYPTIGVEFATKPVPLKTGGTVRVQIWDTGKSEFPEPSFSLSLQLARRGSKPSPLPITGKAWAPS